jgi:hypothetical protein
MKHLKRFNENNDSFAEQLKDFCETNLAYLLDDGGKVQIYHDKIVIISLEEPKDWSHIKDQIIPFLTRLSGKYELNNKYYSTKEKKNANIKITAALTFEHDGDKFQAFNRVFYVNGQKLDCSKETASKFHQLFNSKKEIFEKSKESSEKKEVKDKLKAKYKK